MKNFKNNKRRNKFFSDTIYFRVCHSEMFFLTSFIRWGSHIDITDLICLIYSGQRGLRKVETYEFNNNRTDHHQVTTSPNQFCRFLSFSFTTNWADLALEQKCIRELESIVLIPQQTLYFKQSNSQWRRRYSSFGIYVSLFSYLTSQTKIYHHVE